MNSFIFYNGGLSLAEDGKTVIAPYATEEWKKGSCVYGRAVFRGGFYQHLSLRDDSTQFKAVLNNEAANLVGVVSAGSTSNWADANTNPNFLEMELLSPLQGA